jgi:hypothetical protein
LPVSPDVVGGAARQKRRSNFTAGSADDFGPPRRPFARSLVAFRRIQSLRRVRVKLDPTMFSKLANVPFAIGRAAPALTTRWRRAQRLGGESTPSPGRP